MSAPSAPPAVSIVIPCFNEQDNIVALAAEVAAACAGRNFEIVVVDDASTDRSVAYLQEARGSLGNSLRLICHERNQGQSASVCTGVDHARAPVIATLDGDGQNDPADIPRLLNALAGSPDPGRLIVCGHRRKRRDTWVKRWSSRIANAVRAAALGDDTPDTGCGLKVFERQLFQRLPRFNHMHRFLPALVRRAGGSSTSVEVNHRPRLHGQSKYGVANRLWVGIVDLCGLVWLQRRSFRGGGTEER